MLLWSTLVRQASTSGSADVWRIQWCSNMLNVFRFCCVRLVHHGLLPQCPRSSQIRSWESVPRSDFRFQVDCQVILYLAPKDMARLVSVTSVPIKLVIQGSGLSNCRDSIALFVNRISERQPIYCATGPLEFWITKLLHVVELDSLKSLQSCERLLHKSRHEMTIDCKQW